MGPAQEEKINRMQLSLIYDSRVYTTLLMSLVAILIYAVIPHQDYIFITIWLGWMICVDAYRIYTANAFSVAQNKGEIDVDLAYRHLVTGMILSGIGWGACTVLLYPGADIFNRFILFCAVVGVATASTTTLSYKRNIAFTYVLLIMLPFLAVILYVGDRAIVLGLCVLVYGAFLMKNISVFYRSSHRLLVLELEAEMRELELESEREKALKANASKSEFLANISHELRTPMHAILGFSELGMKKSDSAPVDVIRSYYPKIRTNAERLLGLLNNLLDLSKLEAGGMELDASRNDLLETVNKAMSDVEPMLLDAELSIQAVSNAEDCQADYDPTLILQAILNLLSNAIKYSPRHGCITITINECELESIDGSGNVSGLLVEVTDEGSGIPPDELDTIFGKFVQSSASDKKPGTGLGLSISSHIVRMHGGEISARNNEDAGATFSIRLPRLIRS